MKDLLALSNDLDAVMEQLRMTHERVLEIKSPDAAMMVEHYSMRIQMSLKRIAVVKDAAAQSAAIAASLGRAMPSSITEGIQGPLVRAIEYATRGAIANIEGLDFEACEFIHRIEHGEKPSLLPGLMNGAQMAAVGAFMDLVGKGRH